MRRFMQILPLMYAIRTARLKEQGIANGRYIELIRDRRRTKPYLINRRHHSFKEQMRIDLRRIGALRE